MSDSVLIQQLAVKTTIGVYEWEKKIKQTLLFDITMLHDTMAAAKSDHIDDALDYFEVSKQVTEYVQDHSFELIETVANRVAELILSQFNVSQVSIKLLKPGAVENAASVGVAITRNLSSPDLQPKQATKSATKPTANKR